MSRLERTRWTLALTAASVISAALSGCGSEQNAERRSGQIVKSGILTATAPGAEISKVTRGGRGPIEWGNPFPGAEEIPTLDLAIPNLPFDPLLPGGVGAPAKIFIGRADNPVDTALIYVYDHPTFGVFYVTQHLLQIPPDQAQASLERLGQPCSDEVCTGTWGLEQLRDGRTAVLAYGSPTQPGTNFVEFIDQTRNIRISVVGPPDTFEPQEAVDVANGLLP
jgi:hypothetical protein